VRLGGAEPGKEERVLPAALYYMQPPQTVEGYVFVFGPETRVRLGFKVFQEGSAPAGRGVSRFGWKELPGNWSPVRLD